MSFSLQRSSYPERVLDEQTNPNVLNFKKKKGSSRYTIRLMDFCGNVMKRAYNDVHILQNMLCTDELSRVW